MFYIKYFFSRNTKVFVATKPYITFGMAFLYQFCIVLMMICVSMALPPPLAIPAPELPSGKPLPTSLVGVKVLIVGGSKGIGNATAWEFHNRGASVTITTRHVNNASSVPFQIMELEYGRGNNNVEKLAKKYIKKEGRIPDILVDCGLTSYIGNLVDFSRDDMEYAMRMFAIDPILLVKEFLKSNDVARPFNVSFALSTASYGAATHFIALYAAGKQIKKDWIRDFALYEGPKYYPNVRLVGVACSNVNTTLIDSSYNPSALNGDPLHVQFQQILKTSALLQGTNPVTVAKAHLEVTTTMTYANSTLFLVSTSPTGRFFTEVLQAIYVQTNTTQFIKDSKDAYLLYGLNITSYI